jgi:hypothetical protein
MEVIPAKVTPKRGFETGPIGGGCFAVVLLANENEVKKLVDATVVTLDDVRSDFEEDSSVDEVDAAEACVLVELDSNAVEVPDEEEVCDASDEDVTVERESLDEDKLVVEEELVVEECESLILLEVVVLTVVLDALLWEVVVVEYDEDVVLVESEEEEDVVEDVVLLIVDEDVPWVVDDVELSAPIKFSKLVIPAVGVRSALNRPVYSVPEDVPSVSK